jgi:hypothetical protein
MNLARFNRTEDFALAPARQDGRGFRRDHLDKGIAPRAKSSKPAPRFDCDELFDFKCNLGFSFHLLARLLTIAFHSSARLRFSRHLGILLESPENCLGAFLTFF